MNGYVYMGLDATKTLFKIGFSRDPYRRAKEIQKMNPTFQLLAFAQVPDMRTAEKYLHEKFATKRVVGEWFALSFLEVSEAVNYKVTETEIQKIVEEM